MSHKTNNLESGFISKDKILEYVTEEDIFELVFGYKPIEHELVVSPFRSDTSPRCFFEVDLNRGKLRFTDYADPRVIRGIKMRNIDCFDAVQVFFGFNNFYQALDYIKRRLITGKNISPIKERPKPVVTSRKKKMEILINTREFLIQDRDFWETRYLISKENLYEDKVFPLKEYRLLHTKSGEHRFTPRNIAYAYTEFESGNKKIYSPLDKKEYKFITNCDENDVGGMLTSIKSGRLLIITKSYKDYRVLRNLGLNVRWLQNEGMFPKDRNFWELLKEFTQVKILFDNDFTGISAATELMGMINKLYPNKASFFHIPVSYLSLGISDPSDLLHKSGRPDLIDFLKYHKALL